MSLISEALRKARGDKPGLYPAAHPPPRRALAPWLTAAVSLSVTAGVLIGVFVRRDAPANEAAKPVDVAAAGSATAGAAAPAATNTDPPAAARSRAPAAERQTVIGQDGAAGSARAATPTPTDGRESPQAPPAVDDESVAAPAPPPPEPAPALEAQPVPPPPPAQATAATPQQEGAPTAGATYFRQVTLPGGVQVELGGIAWSESNPAALVGGRVRGPGEGGEDWTVTAVERDRVEIEWQGVRFFLRLK